MNSVTNKSNSNLGGLDIDVDFRALIYIFFENKLLILISMGVVILLSIAYVLYQPYQYTENMLLQVDDGKSGKMNLFQQLAVSSEVNETATQMELIKSRVVLGPVVKKLGLGLNIRPHSTSILEKIWPGSQGHILVGQLIVPDQYDGKSLRLKVIDPTHFQLFDHDGNILISGETKKTLVNSNKGIVIQVNSITANKNAEFDLFRYSDIGIVNSLIPRIQIESLDEGGREKTGIMQVNMKDTDPVRIGEILNTIADVVQDLDISRKSSESQKMLEVYEHQLPAVKASLDDSETTLNRYRASSGKIDIKLETQALMSQLAGVEKQITSLSLQRIALLQNYTTKHPFVIEIRNRIDQLRKEKFSLENQIKKIPAADQIMVSMMRDVQVRNRLYLILLTKIQELRASKEGTLSSVRVLARPFLPEAPLSKQMPVVIAASALLGFILGCLIIMTRKAFHRHIDDPHWIEKNFSIINLAIIPYCKQQTKNTQNFKMKMQPSLDIVVEKYPQDLFSESLRSLRTSFQFILAGATNNIVSITGVSPGIGKSFISINFAYLLSEAGKKILLIDGDMRKGYLNHYFNMDRQPGLSEILLGAVSIEKTLKTSSVNLLTFLPCGNYPPNPSELFINDRFKKFIDTVSAQYDFIIIDTPPVLAVTDSAIIGSLASTNLLVVGSETHQAEEVSLTLKRLENCGVKIQGTIFNYLKDKIGKQGGNYQYSYSMSDSTV